jgi:hypothetical protein
MRQDHDRLLISCQHPVPSHPVALAYAAARHRSARRSRDAP